jgi:hypothetical protein
MLKYIVDRAFVINLFVFTLVFVFLCGLVMQFSQPLNGGDFWMHAGHVRFFSENIFAPISSFDEPSSVRVRNFAPWQFLLANIKNIFDLSTIVTMQVGSVLSVILILVGVWLISGILSSSPFASTALLISVLFVVGTGFAWSEEIHIQSIFLTSNYPSTVAVAISFFCFYFTNKYLAQSNVLYGLAIVLTVSLMLLNHPMVYLHFMVFLFFWVMFIASEWKNRLTIMGLFACGILVSLFWPYFNPIEVSYASVTGANTRWDNVFTSEKLAVIETPRNIFFGGENFLKTMGIAIFSYILMFFIKSKIRWPLLIFAVFCTFMWHFGRTFHLPTSGYRWAMPTIFALQFIYAYHLAFSFEKVTLLKPSFNKSFLFCCLFIAVTGVVSVYNLRAGMWRILPHLEADIAKDYTQTQSLIAIGNALQLDENAVILADHSISYNLVGLDLNPVIFSRRYNKVNTQLINFYNNDFNIKEQKQLLSELKVDFIIANKTKHPSELLNSISSYASKVAEQGRFVAYKLTNVVNN